jgi:glucose-6-phosphate isomerase
MSRDSHAAIAYDYSGLIAPPNAPRMIRETGLLQSDLDWLAPRLATARQEVLDDLALFDRRGTVPPEKDPLDAAFLSVPERLLGPERAELDRLIATGNRLASQCDRVVVLGIGGSYMGARAMFEACCHPYHNELPRKRRGGRPRLYFEGNNVDNDAVQGLLDLLEGDQDWAIIVISKSGGTLETAAAFRIFYDCLRKGLPAGDARLRERVVAVTGAKGGLRDLATALQLKDVFTIPEGVGGRFSALTPVGLLPAAVVGVEVIPLLEGAAAMNERFRTAPPLQCPPLAYAGLARLMETRRGCTIRLLSTWGKRLEALGLWYDQLLSESLGKQGLGATPITVVNTRDLHSRGQQHQEGRRDKLITNVVVERPDRDPVKLEASFNDQDKLNQIAGKTLPDILDAALRGTNQAYAADYRRTAEIRLPRLDEAAVGQLLQMLMIATVVEGRLVGINPYGQPGVEEYKKNMKAILGMK